MIAIKGSTVCDAVSAYLASLPDEYREVLDKLDAGTRAVITGAQANEWVPLDHFVRYLQAQVDVTGEDADALHAHRAELVLERQLRGVYKIFTRLASPETVITRLAAVHTTYLRGVEVQHVALEKGKAILRYVGFEKGHRLMEPIIVGFYRKLLSVNGAKDIEVRFTEPIGGRQGWAELLLTWR